MATRYTLIHSGKEVTALSAATGTNKDKYLHSNSSTGAMEWATAGAGDMILTSVQSVTGLKTFYTTKLAVKGSSTGSTAIASANASATAYTITLPAVTGTLVTGGGTASGTNTGDNAANTSCIAKTTNITALNETGIADGEIAVFNLTNKDIRTSDKTIVTTLGTDDTTVPTSKAVKDVTDARLPLAGGTMTGKTIIAGTTEVAKTYTPATGSQTVALDCSVNNRNVVTGHESGTAITFTITGATNSQCFYVQILQGGTTVSTIAAWFATVRWAGGTAPTLTATLNKRDCFGFIRTGADTYDGCVIYQNA